MPWCPNCETEYREGFTTCSDCGAPLTENWAWSSTAQPDPPALEQPMLLATVAESTELGMLMGMLENAEIPACVRDHHPAGSYLRAYMGKLTYGQQVYVDASRLEEAKELYDAYFAAAPQGESPPDESDPSDTAALRAYERRRRITVICIVVFVAAFFVSVLAGVVSSFL